MISLAIGVVAGLLILQGAINAPRSALMDCLKRASLQAASQRVDPGQYSAFATQQCSAQAASFKAALISFDVKNGIKRAQAAADAQLQVDDFVAMSAEKYESKVGSAKPKLQPAQAPAQPQSN
jgi:hypothetical protein